MKIPTSDQQDWLNYEELHRTPTFRNHFFNWLPVWVIGSVFALMVARPGTPYWRSDVWLVVWGSWTGIYLLVLLSEWSKTIFISVYSDSLEIAWPGRTLRFKREKIIRCELHDTLADNVYQYGWPAAHRLYAIHQHYAKGVRFYIRHGEETAAFVESRHPKELLAALDKMMHADADPDR